MLSLRFLIRSTTGLAEKVHQIVQGVSDYMSQLHGKTKKTKAETTAKQMQTCTIQTFTQYTKQEQDQEGTSIQIRFSFRNFHKGRGQIWISKYSGREGGKNTSGDNNNTFVF